MRFSYFDEELRVDYTNLDEQTRAEHARLNAQRKLRAGPYSHALLRNRGSLRQMKYDESEMRNTFGRKPIGIEIKAKLHFLNNNHPKPRTERMLDITERVDSYSDAINLASTHIEVHYWTHYPTGELDQPPSFVGILDHKPVAQQLEVKQ